MNRLILASFLALAACKTMPEPEPKIVTREIRIPVPVRCIDPAIVPVEPATVQLPLDARLAADLAGSQALLLRKWGRELMAIIGPCVR